VLSTIAASLTEQASRYIQQLVVVSSRLRMTLIYLHSGTQPYNELFTLGSNMQIIEMIEMFKESAKFLRWMR
jgi:hypothetical protein